MSLRNVYKNDITTTTTATATYTNTNNIIIITTIVMMTLIHIFVSISTLWNFYSYRCCHMPCLVCTWQLLGCLQKLLKCHDIRLPLVYIPFQTWCSFSLGMSLLKINDILRLSIISVAFLLKCLFFSWWCSFNSPEWWLYFSTQWQLLS